MRDDFIVTSFGTKTPTVFARCVDKLRNNLDELGVPHDIDLIEPISEKEPRKNATLHVPGFTLDKFYQHKKTIVRTDVDTRILSPDLLPEDDDFDVGVIRNGKCGQYSPLPYVNFIMVIRYTQGGWNFLNIWYKYCLEPYWGWHDHRRLMWAIHTANARFKDVSEFFAGKAIKNGFAENNTKRETAYQPKDKGTNFI